MKSYGGILERATSYSALSDSIDLVVRGTARKESATGRWILSHRDEFICQLQATLRAGTFRISNFHEYAISERGKQRHIQCVPIPDRIPINAVMKEVQRCLRREFIRDTASSIEGRGGLWLHNRVRRAVKENPKLRWFYKCDIRKFYESIPQDKLLRLIDRKFREWQVRQVLRECATLLPSGISIGLRSSQEFGNMYLSYYVDHRLKDREGCKWYWRYCDDIVIAAETPQELTPYIKAVHEGIAEAGLEIKPSEQVFSIGDRPLDFLGYVLHEDGRIALRKHIKQRFARRWKRTLSRTRRRELVGSFYGIAKHSDSINLFKSITGFNMHDFADLGIKYVAQDGKKRFECPSVQLNELQNRTIIVKDYESNIKTANGERTLVLIEDEHGRESKFFTGSEEMIQILDKVREADKFPFRTTIVRRIFGEKKSKYCFT